MEKSTKDEKSSIETILSLKSDFLFKMVFGDERNKDILADFLSAVLSLPVSEFEDIMLLDTVLKREHKDDKLSILDINLRTKNQSLINIEIQMLNKLDFEKRAVYYTGRRLVSQIGKGDSYRDLNPVISINIIDFNLFPYSKYHSVFWMKEETENQKLTEIVRIDFLEMQKAKRPICGTSDGESEDGGFGCQFKSEDIKQLWMDFLNAKTREDLEMLAQRNKIFKKPVAEVIRLSGNEQIRAEYEARQKAIWDRDAEIAYGVEKGRAEGKAEGFMESRLQIAKAFMLQGVSDKIILAATGLSEEELESLRQS